MSKEEHEGSETRPSRDSLQRFLAKWAEGALDPPEDSKATPAVLSTFAAIEATVGEPLTELLADAEELPPVPKPGGDDPTATRSSASWLKPNSYGVARQAFANPFHPPERGDHRRRPLRETHFGWRRRRGLTPCDSLRFRRRSRAS